MNLLHLFFATSRHYFQVDMNQGRLEVVQQEMAKVNIYILGISKLSWTGWANLNQMTIISTTAGKNPLEEME